MAAKKTFFSTVKFCNVSGGAFIGISGHIVELFLLRPSILLQTKQNTFPPVVFGWRANRNILTLEIGTKAG